MATKRWKVHEGLFGNELQEYLTKASHSGWEVWKVIRTGHYESIDQNVYTVITTIEDDWRDSL